MTASRISFRALKTRTRISSFSASGPPLRPAQVWGTNRSPSDGARGVEVDEAGGGAAGAAAVNEDFPEYTVMGVWIASWSQLFPWLVSGHDNQVPRNSQPVGMFKLRRLQQDFLTLARLYRKFARNSNLTVQPMTPNITFEQLADDFTAGASKISDFIAGGIAKTDGPAPDPSWSSRRGSEPQLVFEGYFQDLECVPLCA